MPNAKVIVGISVAIIIVLIIIILVVKMKNTPEVPTKEIDVTRFYKFKTEKGYFTSAKKHNLYDYITPGDGVPSEWKFIPVSGKPDTYVIKLKDQDKYIIFSGLAWVTDAPNDTYHWTIGVDGTGTWLKRANSQRYLTDLTNPERLTTSENKQYIKFEKV